VSTKGATSAANVVCEKLALALRSVFRHRFYVTKTAPLQVTWKRAYDDRVRFTLLVELPQLALSGVPIILTSDHLMSTDTVVRLAQGVTALDANAMTTVHQIVHGAVDHMFQKLVTAAFHE
jgi:hypothetical protein